MPTKNDPAPDFTLPDNEGNLITLSAFREQKNVVLIFYPGDMTPGCTIQLCAIRDEWSLFEAKDAVVFGVNQGSKTSHQAFRDKHHFPFPLLIDKDKTVSHLYDAVFSFLKFSLIRRTVVVIDKHGTIVSMKRGMPKTSEILKAIPPSARST